jgi:hypothetical protein
VPVRRRFSRQHRHHRPAALAQVASDLQYDQSRTASWLKRASHLPIAQAMAVQTQPPAWLVARLPAPGAPLWPDRVDRRRLDRPPLDVHLASND